MAGQNLKERSPTAGKLKPETEASRAKKKKLYQKRTMEEVKRGIHQVENSYDDKMTEDFMRKFREENGSILCKELASKEDCSNLVVSAVRILNGILERKTL